MSCWAARLFQTLLNVTGFLPFGGAAIGLLVCCMHKPNSGAKIIEPFSGIGN